jgi:alkanesulfonate monooxygenase SsuD/methylene tetrahydromethanopterin reductase-like flavin-dependent oxidoreductase (luciferase family)
VWLLGSSHQSAIWAGEWGLRYAFADFINPEGTDPADIVCVSAICADSDEEAERLAASGRMAFSMLRQGRPIPVPPVDKALRYLENRPPPKGRRAVLGSQDSVKAELEAIAQAYNADEVMIVTITHDHAARRRSYELIAEAMNG